jgi:cytochrome c-type biogenesis protein CcmH/NrfG
MLGEFEEAAVSLETATRLAPNNWYAWAGYASVCDRLGRTDEKNEAMQKMKSLAEKMKKAAGTEEADMPAQSAEPAENKPDSLEDITIPE